MTVLPPINIHLADGDHIFRLGLSSLLSASSDVLLTGFSTCGQQTIDLVADRPPHILLIETDIREPDFRETMHRITKNSPPTKVVVLSRDHDIETMLNSYWAGAHSFLAKSSISSSLDATLRLIHAGNCIFSKPVDADSFLFPSLVDYELRELILKRSNTHLRAIFNAVVNGYSNSEIATLLYVSEGTVKSCLSRIMAQMNIRNRVQLAVAFIQSGLFEKDRELLPITTVYQSPKRAEAYE